MNEINNYLQKIIHQETEIRIILVYLPNLGGKDDAIIVRQRINKLKKMILGTRKRRSIYFHGV
jgi:hypothetical protein